MTVLLWLSPLVTAPAAVVAAIYAERWYVQRRNRRYAQRRVS